MPPSKPGSSQQPGPPPDITPNARETQGQGGAGQVAAEQILPAQRGVNPAFLLMGEELFLAASRETWLRAGGAAISPSQAAASSRGRLPVKLSMRSRLAASGLSRDAVPASPPTYFRS